MTENITTGVNQPWEHLYGNVTHTARSPGVVMFHSTGSKVSVLTNSGVIVCSIALTESCSDTATSNITRKDTAAARTSLSAGTRYSRFFFFFFEPMRREEQPKPAAAAALEDAGKVINFSSLLFLPRLPARIIFMNAKERLFFLLFSPPPRCCLILAASQCATHLPTPRCSQFTVTH